MAEAVNDWDILEGFLCPICMKDLKSINQLQLHFEDEHASEDKAVLQSIKGLLNKAKKIILKEEDSTTGFSSSILNTLPEQAVLTEVNNPCNWEPPKECTFSSKTAYFKRIRSLRIDSYVAETNKLLIRLSKLLTNIPSDPVKRKAHEKNIVHWAENKDVPLCPFCATFFNFTTRRHHCRLCGAVMCDDCSKYLSFTFAEKLVFHVTKGAEKNAVEVASPKNRRLSNTLSSIVGGFTSLKRSGSHGSLNSIMSLVDSVSKNHFRVCEHCLARLETRNHEAEMRNCKPLLSVYYKKLSDLKNQLSLCVPQYTNIAAGLDLGDTSYRHSEGVELRLKILKLSDEISMIAQKIRDLGRNGVTMEEVSEDSTPTLPGPRQDLLQRRIYSSTINFLKETVLSLPKLPDEEELSRKLQLKRNEIEERRLQEEAKASPRVNMAETQRLSRSMGLSASKKRSKPVELVGNNGWGGEFMNHEVTETDEPIIQQMKIIRTYIKQAKEAKRHDDAALLEANLRELQLEYKRNG